MASELDICNLALSHVGSDAQVSAIDPPDGSTEAGYCARFYPLARLEMIESHPWTFAKKRVQLAPVTNPSTVWQFAYQLPSDCISATRVLQAYDYDFFWDYPFGAGQFLSADERTFVNERGGADFEVEGSTLLTMEPDAILIYTADPATTGVLSPSFVTAFSYVLAAYLSGPLIKGNEGIKASVGFRQMAFGRDGKGGLAGQARALDANNSSERARHTPDFIKARA